MKCTGLKAVSYPDTRHLIKGNTVQFGTTTRINFMRCYRQLIIVKMETKKCSRCGEVLTLDKFHKDLRYEKGVKGQCRRCVQELTSKRYYDNPEKYKKKMNDWIKSTPELKEKRLIKAYTKYLQDRGFSVTAP